MSTQVSPVVAPSRAQLQDRLRIKTPKLTLYNPAQEWFIEEHDGVPFYFPPDLGEGRTAPHPATGKETPANGRLEVGTRYGNLINEVTKKPAGYGPIPGCDADAIVMFFVENYSERGICWLENDPVVDAGKIAASKKIYAKFRRGWADDQRVARAEFVRNWENVPQNKGRKAPPPTPIQIKAQEFLDEIAENKSQDAEYICRHGCYETNDYEKFSRHMRVNHNEDVPKPDREMAAPKVTVAPIPPGKPGEVPQGRRATARPEEGP